MLTFLSDGTLIMDSCWETYRLSRWRRGENGSITWNEDGKDIVARIAELDSVLVLDVALVSGTDVQRYRPAPVPFVCPEMPR